MTDIAIRVERLSKQFRLGRGATYGRLSEAIENLARKIIRGPWDRLRARNRPVPSRDFWALRNVSFEVHAGEVVGIIGRNGAGKSTLLKILSRIIHPTEGRAEIIGRVGSLLEVGTGFHPELTGRENIFVNGAILGMSRGEILRKFDEIVAFSEIEAFLDTPVKRYSSGMSVRLAFAVAAHLEPEILIVNEVLAVGDTSFHKKCLGKMDEVSRQGRTVLVVSHNLPSIIRLCSRAMLLEAGEIVARRARRRLFTPICQPSAPPMARSSGRTSSERQATSGSSCIRWKFSRRASMARRATSTSPKPSASGLPIAVSRKGLNSIRESG